MPTYPTIEINPSSGHIKFLDAINDYFTIVKSDLDSYSTNIDISLKNKNNNTIFNFHRKGYLEINTDTSYSTSNTLSFSVKSNNNPIFSVYNPTTKYYTKTNGFLGLRELSYIPVLADMTAENTAGLLYIYTDKKLHYVDSNGVDVILNPTMVNTFNSRSGTVVPTSGDYNTLLVTENTNLYFTENRVQNSVMSAYVLGANTSINNTDTLVLGLGKIQGQINTINSNFSNYLPLSGGILTNYLTLSGLPINSLHAVTKSYVDNFLTGITFKNACLVATTTDIVLSGNQTIDGISVTAGMRVLVKNQINQLDNGIYISSASAWSRSSDADTGTEIETATVFIEKGTVNKDTQWTCTSVDVVINTTNIRFGQISGAGTYTSGTGITLTGNVFSVNDGVLQTIIQSLNGTQQSNARSNLGLGDIATQSSSSITITGGTINSTSIGASTPSTGVFTTINGTTSLTITTAGSSTSFNSSIASGLLYTVFGSQTINAIASQNYNTNMGTSGSGLTYLIRTREDGFVGIGAFDRLPVKSSTITYTYPTNSTSGSRFNELLRIHYPYVANQNGLGSYTSENTLTLWTSDHLDGGLFYSKAIARLGNSQGGYLEFYHGLTAYSDRVIRVGTSNSAIGFGGVYMSTSASSTFSNTNSSGIGFSNGAGSNSLIHIVGDGASSGIGAGFCIQSYNNFGGVGSIVNSGGVTSNGNAVYKKYGRFKVGNGANTYTDIIIFEHNGSMRLNGGLEIGLISTLNYMGGFATDVVKLYVRGAVSNYMSVLESGTGGVALDGSKPNIAVQQHQVDTTDATPTTLYAIAIPTNATMKINVSITARRTGGIAGAVGDSAGFIMTGLFKNIAGTVTQVGTLTYVDIKRDDASVNASLVVSGTNVNVTVNGLLNVNYHWHGDEIETSRMV